MIRSNVFKGEGLAASVKGSLASYRFHDFVFVLLVVISGCALAHQDTTLVGASVYGVMPKVRYALVLLFIALGHKEFRVNWTVLIPFVFLLITSLDKFPSPQISNVLICLELMTFCLLNEDCQMRIFRLFRIAVLAIAAVGIVCYASYSLGLGLPYRDVPYYFGELGKMKYADYGFSYIYVSIGYSEYPRLCGLFNEPGYLGTVLALLLCVEGFDARRPSTWIILVAGAMTLSLAFASIVGIYLVLTSVKKTKNLVFAGVVAVLVICALSSGAFDGTPLGRYMERILDFIANGGDTSERTNAVVDFLFSSVVAGNDAIWGCGGGYTAAVAPDGIASYKAYVIDYGVAGAFLILVVPFLAGLLRAVAISDGHARWIAICFCICFLLNIVQRPAIYVLPYFVLLFGGIQYIAVRSARGGRCGELAND